MSNLIGFGTTMVEPISLTYISSAMSNSNLTTYNFGDFSIPADGLAIVGGVARGSVGGRTVSSISIGGTNGTIHVNPTSPCAIASRVVSAGSHNVTVTASGSCLSGACFVWLLENYQSATPHDTAADTDSSPGTSTTVTLDIPANGITVFVHFKDTTASESWSSAVVRQTQSGEDLYSGADKSSASGIVGHSETTSWSGNSGSATSAVSWA